MPTLWNWKVRWAWTVLRVLLRAERGSMSIERGMEDVAGEDRGWVRRRLTNEWHISIRVVERACATADTGEDAI